MPDNSSIHPASLHAFMPLTSKDHSLCHSDIVHAHGLRNVNRRCAMTFDGLIEQNRPLYGLRVLPASITPPVNT